MRRDSPAGGTILLAALADVVCLVFFVFVGRRSHQETSALAAFLSTAWPFLAGLVLAWLITRAWRRPTGLWPTAVLIWAITVAGGLGFRIVSGQGVSGAFPLVASGFLALVLIGWRLVARLSTRSP